MAKILIIDDDRSLLNMVKLMVQRESHDAVLAQNGQEGLALAFSERPDLTIIDLMMPGMSGYEVMRRLREDARTAEMPLLILTARFQPMDEQMARDSGANAFLSKPVTAQELMAQVNALLSTSRPGVKPGGPAVITVLGLRGGAGATTIALNLALGLMAQGQQACLVDLSPFSGHAALQLRIITRQSWSDLLTDVGTPTPEQIRSVIVTHDRSKLAILPAPAVPLSDSMSEEIAKSVFTTLGKSYTTVVVDAPSLGSATLTALRHARAIVVPMTDDVLAIQTTSGVLQWLKTMHIDLGRVRIVLNHVRADVGVPIATVQKAIRHPVHLELPYESAQVAALAQGTPLVMSQPKSAFVQGILRLARTV